MYKAIRIFILLTILIIVAGSTYLTKMRTTDWDTSLWVSIYPINGDNTQAVKSYIQQLKTSDFHDIEAFLTEEGKYYKIPTNQPIKISIAPQVMAIPPAPPQNRSSIFSVMFWSLQLRYWAFNHDTDTGPAPDVQIFVVYNDPANQQKLPHSLGLEKGHIGVVHAYAGRQFTRKNNVVIAHEFLHTLGAKDKYDFETGYPHYPDGFANPDEEPRFPQNRAEIMAGQMAISETISIFPKSLYRVVVGKKTATEINWLSDD